MWRDAGQDGYDTMKWIVEQKWSNKDIYSVGGSADGIAAYLETYYKPPWLKGQFVLVSSAQMHATDFQGGAYRNGLISGWLNGIHEKEEVRINVDGCCWWWC